MDSLGGMFFEATRPATTDAPTATPAAATTDAPTDATAAFVQRFSATPHGARLARLLAVRQLDVWGIPYGSAVSDTSALVVGELAANAVTHGRVPGRDFELRLVLAGRRLWVAVSDTRGEALPPGPGELPAVRAEDAEGDPAESGRGLVLVDALAARWAVVGRDGPGKTVWAEVPVEPPR